MKRTNTASTTKRICIVTSDFAGITHNGGIGTACANLSYALKDAGHDVTVLYTFDDIGDGNVLEWQSKLADMGITLELLPFEECTSYGVSSFHQNMSLRAYLWLRENDDFDFIHFPDWRGTGYYTALAKHTGTAFHQSQIIIQLHSPTIWHRAHNNEDMASIDLIDTHVLEKEAVALADAVVSPSDYLIKWCKSQKWAFPVNTNVVQNLLSPNFALSDYHEKLEAKDIKEIVFFGRLEVRKGALLFCKALAKLPPQLLKGKKITFLGKESLIGKKKSLDVIEKQLSSLPIKWQALTDKNSDEAIAYLQGKGRMVVIASLVENSPYVVLESLGFGFPFIATDSGGTAELVRKQDRKEVLFAPDVKSLTQKLTSALNNGVVRARMSVEQHKTRETWLDIHQKEEALSLPDNENTVEPINEHVGVCIFFRGDLRSLRKAIVTLQQESSSALLDIMVVPVIEMNNETAKELSKLCSALLVDLDTPRTSIAFDVFFPATHNYVLYMHEDCTFVSGIIHMLITKAQHLQSDVLTSLVGCSDDVTTKYHLPVAANKDLLSLYNSIGSHYFFIRQSLFTKMKKASFSLPLEQCFWELLSTAAKVKYTDITLLPDSICTTSYAAKSLKPSKLNKNIIKKISNQLVS